MVRGAATVRYGSQAIGGVVNAINNRIPLGLPNAPLSGEASGSYSTGNKAGDGSVLLDGRVDQFAFHADGYIRSASDYDIPGGTQTNSFFKGDGESLGGSYFFGGSRVGGAVIHYDALYGVPSDVTHIKMRQTKGLVGSSFDIGAGPLKTITVDGGYGDYKHDEIDTDGTVLDTFIDKEWDSRVESLFGQMGPFSSSAFGIQVQHRDFSALGSARAFLEPTLTSSEAGFAFTELPVSDIFKLQFGARVEQNDLKGTPAGGVLTRVSFTPVSGSASLVFNPAEMVTLGLTVSSAARAPNVVELFAHGPHDGPGTFERGDPTLSIERANSLEGTVRVNMSDLQLEGSLWGVSFDSYIHGQLTGATCDDTGACSIPGPGDFKELIYSQGGARFWGIEGKAAKSLLQTNSGTVVGDIHADYVRATLKVGGDVPLIPPYRVGGGIGWQSDMLDADVHVTYTGAQNRTGAALSATAGYVDLHLGITYRPTGLLPGLTLSAFADNLTDSTQRNAVALNRDLVVLPGRNFRLVARYTF